MVHWHFNHSYGLLLQGLVCKAMNSNILTFCSSINFFPAWHRIFLSLCLCLCVSLSLCVYISVTLCLYVSVFCNYAFICLLLPCLRFSVSLCLCVSLLVSLFISVSLCLRVSVFLCLRVFVSLWYTHAHTDDGKRNKDSWSCVEVDLRD